MRRRTRTAPPGRAPRRSPALRVVPPSLALLAAAAIAAAAPAATAPAPPQLSAVTIDAGRVASSTRATLTGHLTCSKGARYRVSAWVVATGQAAFAKGAFPAKLAASAPKAVVARVRSATLCTGTAQPWAVVALAAGARSAPLRPGPAEACVLLTADEHRLYALQALCSQTALG